jgi:hypothetical protein
MTKSKFTLIVIFLTIIFSSPTFAKDNETIEMELNMLNESQQITNEILEEIKEQLANDSACPCFSVAQLNKLLEDYGPFLPDPGGQVPRSACEGPVTQGGTRIVNHENVIVRKRDYCEGFADIFTNRQVRVTATDDTGELQCSYSAFDKTDDDPSFQSDQQFITPQQLQLCRVIALQWAQQNGIQ